MPSGPSNLSEGTNSQFEWCEDSFCSSSTAETHSSVAFPRVQLRQRPTSSPPAAMVVMGKSCALVVPRSGSHTPAAEAYSPLLQEAQVGPATHTFWSSRQVGRSAAQPGGSWTLPGPPPPQPETN